MVWGPKHKFLHFRNGLRVTTIVKINLKKYANSISISLLEQKDQDNSIKKSIEMSTRLFVCLRQGPSQNTKILDPSALSRLSSLSCAFAQDV